MLFFFSVLFLFLSFFPLDSIFSSVTLRGSEVINKPRIAVYSYQDVSRFWMENIGIEVWSRIIESIFIKCLEVKMYLTNQMYTMAVITNPFTSKMICRLCLLFYFLDFDHCFKTPSNHLFYGLANTCMTPFILWWEIVYKMQDST